MNQHQNPVELLDDFSRRLKGLADRTSRAPNVAGFALRLRDRDQAMGAPAAIHDCPRCGQGVLELAGR